MKRPLLAGAALGVIAFLAPQMASAQCEKRLTEAAQAVGTLPNGTDYRVHDTLNEFYHEAEGLMGSDEAGCLSAVQRMEDLIRRNGGVAGEKGGVSPLQVAEKGSNGDEMASADVGGARPGFIPINPVAASDMDARIGGLSPERQREARAADTYARATHALGSSIVNSAAAPSENVNRIATATNHAVEMAEAARDAMLAERNRFSIMVQNLISRLADERQTFELALNSAGLQAALPPTAEARIAPAKAAYAEAAQGTDILIRRAEEIETANLAEGMAPGFAEAYRALARRHRDEMDLHEQPWEVAKDNYFIAVASMNQGRADAARAELLSVEGRVTVVRQRQLKEVDDLYRQYSTMVIDLTQPDGRPAQESRPRRPRAGGGSSPEPTPQSTPPQSTPPQPAPQEPGPTEDPAEEPARDPAEERAFLEQDVASAENLLRETERLAAKYPNDPDMPAQLDYFRTRVAEARAALTNHLRDSDPEEYQRQIGETARAELAAKVGRERTALEREVASAEYMLRDAQRVAANHPDPINEEVVNHARVRLQEANGALNGHLMEHDQAAYQRRTSEAARAAERTWADQQRTTLERDVANAEYLLRDTERIAANYPNQNHDRDLALARGRVAEAQGALNHHNRQYAPPNP